MGRSVTPKYKLEVRTPNPRRVTSAMCWKGRATAATLEAWVRQFNASLKPGGANHHLLVGSSEAMERVVYARITENRRDGAVVAEYTAPMFEVL